MKEITRIHIAKIAYDIEAAAKKDIEHYMEALKKYAEDSELLDDIEIRITEILAERGVRAGGVIVGEDIKAVRAQLGEPQDFLDEETVAGSSGKNQAAPRKLYRDVDNSILGGVMSGIAQYLRIDPIWTRLIFLALLFASFGMAFMIYIVLWLIMPPARTAAEKLQMSGQPVNLASIREFVEEQQTKLASRDWAGALKRVLAAAAGIMSLTLAIGTLLFTILATIWIGHDINSINYLGPVWLSWLALSLASISGVLLAILFALISVAFFVRSLSKKVATAMIAIIVCGLMSFMSAAGIVFYQSNGFGFNYQSSIQESYLNLPANFSSVKSLTISDVNLHNANLEYVVSTNPRIVMTTADSNAKPIVSVDGDSATVKLETNDTFYNPGANFKIYGPALDNLIINNSSISYGAEEQSALTVTAESSSIYITGNIQALTATANENSTVSASGAAVESAKVTTELMSTVELGNIKHLEVTQPEVCPSSTSQNNQKVAVESVSEGVITYNDQSFQAKTYKTQCGSVIIGSNQEVKYDSI